VLTPQEPCEPDLAREDARDRGDLGDNLRLDGVGHRFGDGAWLFRGLQTELRSGRSYALVGPSGSGKSTLLSIIAGWQPPVEGEVVFTAATAADASTVAEGDAISARGGAKLAAAKRRATSKRRAARRAAGTPRISWVFQNPFGVAGRTVRDHVMLPILARGTEVSDAAAEADELLAQLRLGHLADRVYRELSGGEAQRLMIARGIASQPDVFLVDEPTAQLDRATAAEVNRTLTALTDVVRGGRTIVVVATHDPDTRDACSDLIDLAHFAPNNTAGMS
jgi:ABC-type lipoprotein export system ATPase subunit